MDIGELAAQRHSRELSRSYRVAKIREHRAELFARIQHNHFLNSFAKVRLVAERLVKPGPPLDVALGWIHQPCQRAALATLFSGDMFIARYAANYFAKRLVPQRHETRLDLAINGVDADRVCLFCWSSLHVGVFEDEAHGLLECPCYGRARDVFFEQLTVTTRSALNVQSATQKLAVLLSSHRADDWRALGYFCFHVRQIRRQRRCYFQQLQHRLENADFGNRKQNWLGKGRLVCRHGVFWRKPRFSECSCMSHNPCWEDAVYMPYLDEEIKQVVAKQFDPGSFHRLGQIRAKMRQKGW